MTFELKIVKMLHKNNCLILVSSFALWFFCKLRLISLPPNNCAAMKFTRNHFNYKPEADC